MGRRQEVMRKRRGERDWEKDEEKRWENGVGS